jgi:hypothetical protein
MPARGGQRNGAAGFEGEAVVQDRPCSTAGVCMNGALYTFRIKDEAKKDIRERLKQMFGYDHSTIYPDYSGFSLFGTPNLKSRP